MLLTTWNIFWFWLKIHWDILIFLHCAYYLWMLNSFCILSVYAQFHATDYQHTDHFILHIIHREVFPEIKQEFCIFLQLSVCVNFNPCMLILCWIHSAYYQQTDNLLDIVPACVKFFLKSSTHSANYPCMQNFILDFFYLYALNFILRIISNSAY